MTRKDGRFSGILFQQAFIILATIEGVPSGISSRSPSLTWSVCVYIGGEGKGRGV